MKISVIGAGGVGGYFGARLAKAGHDVQFLARGKHLAAMREGGLRIESQVESFVIDRVRATDKPAELDAADVMLVTTKLWDLAGTARDIAGAVGDNTVVVPFQNGVDAVDILAESLPRKRVAAGSAYIAALISGPGTIQHTGTMARLRVGALDPAQKPVLQAFAQAGADAGFGAEYVEDAPRLIWEKFVMLNALSGATALTRQTVGVIRSDPELQAIVEASAAETAELARRSGVPLPADFVATQLKAFAGLPAEMRASMAHDLLAGRRLEAPWLCGAVVRRGQAAGLPVPVNATIWAALKPFAAGSAT